MERYELKRLLDGLDQAHAELIHAHLCYGLVNAPLSEMIGQEMVEQYRRLCDRLIKEKDGAVLPELNEVCCHLVDAIDEEMQGDRVSESLLEEPLGTVRRLASKPVRIFAASLKERMSDVGLQTGSSDDIDAAFTRWSPLVVTMSEQVENGHYEEAVGNLLELFSSIASLKVRHGEWFENMQYGGQESDMTFLLDAATALYCHLRQREDLPKDLAEDMDAHLLLLNARTGLFGNWTVCLYADMLCTAECQSEDYSDLENCGIWNAFTSTSCMAF